MNILGLHLGHDGGVAIVCDGVTKNVLLTERLSRVKHARTVDASMIDDALRDAGLTIGDIDYCAVSTTQTHPLVTLKEGRLHFRFARHPDDKVPSAKEQKYGDNWAGVTLSTDGQYDKQLKVLEGQAEDLRGGAKSRLAVHRASVEELDLQFCPEAPLVPEAQDKSRTFDDMAQLDCRPFVTDDKYRFYSHAPITVVFDGREIPAAFVDHHACHAASTYYQSGFHSAAVLTFDGATSRNLCSGAYVGRNNKLYRLAVPQLWMGWFYSTVANAVGLGYDAGKLMGLSSYGKPRFFDPTFAGTVSELGFANVDEVAAAWLQKLSAKCSPDELKTLGDKAHLLEALSIDVAASAHMTFEENVLKFLKVMRKMIRSLPPVEGLCLSGGCALSCPTNTRAALESGFARVFVEPSCDDSGLSVGAALWAYHNLLDRPIVSRDRDFPVSPYLGRSYSRSDVERALSGVADKLIVEDLGSKAPVAAAKDLVADKIIGWFEGRSEIGPRALGHRSILADPRRKENWARTNKIKGREGWRPFAPAVLEEDAKRWFKDMPLPSPYMLFTGNVTEPDTLPAITHVDGTARVQTVGPVVGGYYHVIREFRDANGGVGVVLNTSLNGPGEPIVESPEDALAFFQKSQLDAIYIDGFRVTRK